MPDSVDFSRKPVLVLGASGFIGSHLVAALNNSAAYRPVAASRREGLQVDTTNPESMRAALRDVDCVVNCMGGNNAAMVRSTEVLCDAARMSPPRRIIYLSSMAVYGAASGTVQENQSPVVPISAYGQAKIDCERIVRKYVEDGGDAVILRPTCVFGPGSPQWTTRLIRLLVARRIGDLGIAGDGCCNLAFIDDLVAGVVASLNAPGISGRAFNISSSAELTWNEFFIAFAKALGATPVRRVPQRVLRIETKLLAPIRRIAAIAVRSSLTEAITPSLMSLWRQDIRIECSAAEDALALPRTPVDQMIAAVLPHKQGVQQPVYS